MHNSPPFPKEENINLVPKIDPNIREITSIIQPITDHKRSDERLRRNRNEINKNYDSYNTDDEDEQNDISHSRKIKNSEICNNDDINDNKNNISNSDTDNDNNSNDDDNDDDEVDIDKNFNQFDPDKTKDLNDPQIVTRFQIYNNIK